ncbi:MAG: Ltp family lipoprotein, partial [Microthrixaceae bacterium]
MLPPPYIGPPTASTPHVIPPSGFSSPVMPPSVPQFTAPQQAATAGTATATAVPSVQWYFTWWALVPFLLLCWPVGLVLLWISPQSRGAKVGASAVTAVFFGLLLLSSGNSDSGETASERATNVQTSTTELGASSVKPTTSTVLTTTTTTTTPTTVAPTTTTPTTIAPTTTLPPPPPTAPPAPAISTSQSNARRSASSYLDFSAFSRTGLISQLEFEGYSTADAAWAVDDLNPDWNQQAAKKAASYLDFSGFSRSGLVDQLLFEGFTQAQAEYGVSTTGL